MDIFRAAYATVLKICKLMLTVVGHAKVQAVIDACSADPQIPTVSAAEHSHAVILQQALHHIPHPNSEFTTRNVAMRLGQQLGDAVSLNI